MSDAPHRQSARFPMEIRVEYKRLNAFISDLTRDLSGRGFFVRTDHPLALGTECLFTLKVPRLDEALTLRGVVRRVVTPAEAGDDEPGMGVELIFDDDAERQALQTVVDSLMVDHLGATLFGHMRKMRSKKPPE
ncbi:MAG: TIGR02266 family protein [Myxococcales bacterium]|nr:TIGR02266 family protein [Myxococcales bacterium]